MKKLTTKTLPPALPLPITKEMERLAAISSLFSPTAGWAKVKGLRKIESLLNVKFATKIDMRMAERNPWDNAVNDPAIRAEATRATKGILGETEKLVEAALKPAGWKLRAAAGEMSNHRCQLWTRKGKQVAVLAHLTKALPECGWINNGKRSFRNWLEMYSCDVHLTLAAGKGSEEALREAGLALDAHISGVWKKTHALLKGKKISARAMVMASLAPREVSDEELSIGMPEIQVTQQERGSLPPQHRKLIDQLIGQVRVVAFPNKGSLQRTAGILTTELGGVILRNCATWEEADILPGPGMIRLVAHGKQGMVKWTETFGADETVPAATVKRLLANTRTWSNAPWYEQKAVYRSVGAA